MAAEKFFLRVSKLDRYSVGELVTGFIETETVAICEESGIGLAAQLASSRFAARAAHPRLFQVQYSTGRMRPSAHFCQTDVT
jgi:hypothetical protein